MTASTLNPPLTERTVTRSGRKKVWIDLENSPHVPFFRPIIDELEARGYSVTLTARDCFQVVELADMVKLRYKKVGRHYGKNSFAKVLGLCIRCAQMMPGVLKEKPDLAVSHGSRSLFTVAALLGIPTITIVDYEHAKWVSFPRLAWVMAPEIIPDQAFIANGIPRDHILKYPGIKEDVYTPFFRPNLSLQDILGLRSSDVVVTIRPPATEAHYHNPESEKLLMAVFELLAAHPEVKTILLPRTPRQEASLRQARPDLFAARRIVVPEHVRLCQFVFQAPERQSPLVKS